MLTKVNEANSDNHAPVDNRLPSPPSNTTGSISQDSAPKIFINNNFAIFDLMWQQKDRESRRSNLIKQDVILEVVKKL